MSNMKFTYFDGAGLGIGTRLALIAANQPFEDFRLSNTSWPEFKATTPLGQVPLLEIDGTIYTQSLALLRYAAGKAGFSANATLEEKLIIDEVVYIIDDAFSALPRASDDMKAARENWVHNKLFVNLKRIEEYIKKSGTGYVSPTGISIADLRLFGLGCIVTSGYLDHVAPSTITEHFPAIAALYEKIYKDSRFTAYFAAHPKETPFAA